MYFRISHLCKSYILIPKAFVVAGKKNKGDDAAKDEEGKRQKKIRDALPVRQYSKKV